MSSIRHGRVGVVLLDSVKRHHYWGQLTPRNNSLFSAYTGSRASVLGSAVRPSTQIVARSGARASMLGKRGAVGQVTARRGSRGSVLGTARFTPGAPGNFQVVAGDTTATLTWTAAAANGSPVTTYWAYKNGALITPPLGNVLTYTATGLPNGTPVSFAVRAVNAAGAGLPTSTITVTPSGAGLPSPPADVTSGRGADRLATWGTPEDGSRTAAAAAGFGGDSWGWGAAYRFGASELRFKGSTATGDPAVSGNPYLYQHIIEDIAISQHPAGWETFLGPKIKDFRGATSRAGPFVLTNDTDLANWELSAAELAQFIAWHRTIPASQGGGTIVGSRYDTEQGFWGFNPWSGREYPTDLAYRQRYEAWGYAHGRGIYQNDPNHISVVYNWLPPGGYAYENAYQSITTGSGLTSDNRSYGDTAQHPTMLWYGEEATGPKHCYWLGYMKAMADFGGSGARFVRSDAFYYDASAVSPNRLKYETQGTIAALSQPTWNPGGGMPAITQFSDTQWAFLCDKIDISFFSWPGTDWSLAVDSSTGATQVLTGTLAGNHVTITGGAGGSSPPMKSGPNYVLFHTGPGAIDKFSDYPISNVTASGFDVGGLSGVSGSVTFSRFAVRTSDIYKVAGEPEYADQLQTMKRYAMGRRQFVYALQGTYSYWEQYDKIRRGDVTNAAALVPGFTTKQKWWTYSGTNPPGGHVPGLQAAASTSPVSTTPPTITANAPTNNGDGTFTITGEAFHADGIRCVRGYVHPSSSNRRGARLTWDRHGGTVNTNFNSATQDYSLRLTGSTGQFAMVTAVSVHDQEHSIRVQL